MKKLLHTSLCILLAGTATLRADVLLRESFAYEPDGSLLSQGQWVSNGSAGSNPIKITAGSLIRSGYQDEEAGNSIALGTDMGKTSYQVVFAPGDGPAISGKIYYSVLLRVDKFPASLGKPGALISLTGANDGQIGDNITSKEGAGLYVKKGSADDKALIGISRQGNANGVIATNVVWADTEVALGETVLAVVCFEQKDGSADDEVSLWLNPADASAVPAASQGASASDVDDTISDVRGIAVSQRSALTSKIPGVTLDELRVATTWDELFSTGEAPKPVPTVTFSENPVDFGHAYCNISVSRTVIVRGTDLTSDITIATGESGQVQLSTDKITREAAMSEAGAQLTITLTPVESRFFYDNLRFSTEGAIDRELRVQWSAVPSTVATTLAQFCDEDNNDMTSVYVYKGEATVTFVESYYDLSYDRVVNSIFCQDATGGAELRSALGCGYDEIDVSGVRVGDKLTDIVGQLIFGDSGLTFIPRTADAWKVVSHDNAVEPIELTLRQLASADDGYVYGNQLVRVKHVAFPIEYYEAGDYHGLWNSQKYKIYDGTMDDYMDYTWMWCNQGADYFKTSTEGYFDNIWTLTGIVNSYYPLHISPRSKADFALEGPNPAAGIEDVALGAAATEVESYDLQGRRATPSLRGMRIVKMSDGSVRKVINR